MHPKSCWPIALTILICVAPLGSTAPPRLSLDQRLAAQEAIYRVYYSHRIGASKPFEAVATREVLLERVQTYLKQTVALEAFWDTAVTSHMLRHEAARISKSSRMPGRLRELYTALGDDPVLIQECLVRPVLVDRQARNFFAYDQEIHADARRRAEVLHEQLVAGQIDASAEHPRRTVLEMARAELGADEFDTRLAKLGDRVGWIGPLRDEREHFSMRVVLEAEAERIRVASFVVPKRSWADWWAEVEATLDPGRVDTVAQADPPLDIPDTDASSGAIDLAPADLDEEQQLADLSCVADNRWTTADVIGRHAHSAIWTGSLMLIWGGSNSATNDPPSPLETGMRYDPTTDSWTPMSTLAAPAARFRHTAVWTGSLMIVWGGTDGTVRLKSGGRYDPLSNRWESTSSDTAPSGREYHTAVWTDSKMVVWGGSDGASAVNTGGRYDPDADSWLTTSTASAPMARAGHTAVWTDSKMVVWGGFGGLDTGGLYDPVANFWTPTTESGAPSGRSRHSAVWTGEEMLIWGGGTTTGGLYDPQANSWQSMSTANSPDARVGHSTVWTDSLMIVWGGSDGGGDPYFNTGGRYDPDANTWTSTSTFNAPPGRQGQSAVWTGSLMVVWGGALDAPVSLAAGESTYVFDSGGRYNPMSNNWTPTSKTTPPSARSGHTAVWTGSVMVVWGGQHGASRLDTGGRYDLWTGTWTATSTTGAPQARADHTAVWTGDEMVVWGGQDGSYLGTGGRYEPLSDSWTTTSTTAAPTPRVGHTAIWTGEFDRRMVVWGGNDAVGYFNSGARYDPDDDVWEATSMTGAPSVRTDHTAVWSGNEMFVWGGFNGSYLNTGARYKPLTDIWNPITTDNAPSPRARHTAVWRGGMTIWGGYNGSSYTLSGGNYILLALPEPLESWAATETLGAPQPRADHTAIWTGNEMVVWGGFNGSSLGNGGALDSFGWTTVSSTDDPSPRTGHTAPWTGSFMAVWGGVDDGIYHDSGAVLAFGHTRDDDGDGLTECQGDCDDADPDCTFGCWADADGDGTPDCGDACPNDPNKIEPGICGCGSVDIDENEDGICDASAGDDQHVSVGELVTLDGSGSTGAVSYSWVHVPEPGHAMIELDDADMEMATFTAGEMVETLIFELTVTDGLGNMATDSVSVTVLEDVDHAIFASATRGSDLDPGTMAEPVKTVSHAFVLAALSEPRSDIYLHEADYDTPGTLTVQDDMSVYGGFEAVEHAGTVQGWTRTAQGATRILGEATAIKALSVTSPTTIDGLTIQSANGSPGGTGNPGQNSIGLYVHDCDEHLRISNNSILAGLGGRGGAGQTGGVGDLGSLGGHGDDAFVFLTPAEPVFNFSLGGEQTVGDVLRDYIVPNPDGLANGGHGAGASCGAHGGRGGNSPGMPGLVPNAIWSPTDPGYHMETDSAWCLLSVIPTACYDTSGFRGARQLDQDDNGGAFYIDWINPFSPEEHIEATVGVDGVIGSAGAGNEDGGDRRGQIVANQWVGGSGGRGDRGRGGSRGGGGGGGGYPDLKQLGIGAVPLSGGGGGGGGSGGCGGEGGEGGQPGGGSFGIFLTGSKPTLVDNVISTTGGGDAGQGGQGGAGGVGGPGGNGGNGVDVSVPLFSFESGDGKQGGRGGQGGAGGGGSGGAGGASCGIYLVEGAHVVSTANCFTEDCDELGVSLVGPAGQGAAGGPGGAGSGSQAVGDYGENGLRLDICPEGAGEPVGVGVIDPDGEEEHTAEVNAETGGASFGVSIVGSDVVMTLTSPSGRVIDRDTTDADVIHVNGPNFEVYTIIMPEAGVWTVRLFGADVPPEGEPYQVWLTTTPANNAPVASCQDVTAVADESCVADADVDAGSSDPDEQPLEISVTPEGPYALGDTVVTLTIEDSEGASESCQATVSVVDETQPAIECPDPVTATAGPTCVTSVTLSAMATDGCDSSVELSDNAPAAYAVGNTTVTFTATDESGNSSSCETSVVVQDDAPPSLTCPPDVVRLPPVTPDDIGLPIASDECDVSPLVIHDAPEELPLGVNIINWSATDASGNAAACVQTVRVGDIDFDGFAIEDGDCDDGDPATYPGAPETNDGVDNQCPGAPGSGLVDELETDAGFRNPNDKTEYSWTAQDGASAYRVARSGFRDFSAGCTVFTTADTKILDPTTPPDDQVYHYLAQTLAPHEGSWGEDSAHNPRVVACLGCVPDPPEVCDGLDNDCDGAVDGPGSEASCSLDNAVSTCAGGSCVVASCAPEHWDVNGDPSDGCEYFCQFTEEVCDGLDNDCDGVVDEFTTTCGEGACQATGTCTGGVDSCTPGTPQTEVCDNVDNDCDGTVDDFSVTCGLGVCEATGTCIGGVPFCFPDPPQPTDEPDSAFIDDNCDGIDGEIGRAVFVSATTGNDANDGSMESPVASIDQGLLLAQAGVRDQVLVAEGSYPSRIILESGVGVHGGYEAAGWSRSASHTKPLVNPPYTTNNLPAVLVTAGTVSDATLDRLHIVASAASPSIAGQSSIGVFARNAVRLTVVDCDIEARDGIDGADGSLGAVGNAGEAGLPGEDRIHGSQPQPQPGAGGAGAFAGGTGGLPGRGYLEAGESGQAGAGSAGGEPGQAGASSGGAGGPGGDGADGALGAHGNGGLSFGALGSSSYTPVSGQGGQPGTAGSGGGGGGGGGGVAAGIPIQWGAAGGGGGGGGFPGAGGGRGTGGGGSFGIILDNCSDVWIEGNFIATGNGGSGGDGRAGGDGGQGGIGGPGGTGPGDGGTGGSGGDGGLGGAGGGGGGGPSIGIVAESTTFDSVTGNTFMIGSAGAGGSSPGNPGQNGRLHALYQF